MEARTFIGVTLFFFCTTTETQLNAQSGKLKSIESLMKAANEIGVFTGNILIAEDGKIIYKNEFGFADTTKTKLLKSESGFAIGSITKELFTTPKLLNWIQQIKLQKE